MHLKRNKAPRIWQIERKGTKYLVRTTHNLENSVPLLIVLRNMMKIARNRKEARQILNLGKIKINGKIIKEDKFPLVLFDNLTVENKNFRIVFKNKKFGIMEISEKESEEKIAKIINKKMLKGEKIQINLNDGRNYISKEKAKTGDSAVIDLKEGEIKSILPLKQGCKIMFITGKHLGEKGIVEGIEEKSISVQFEGRKINSKIGNLMVIK